jgi:hypothetical protein
MIVQLAHFVNILGAAILTGGLVMAFMAVAPLLRSLPANWSVVAHQEFDRHADPYLPISCVISAVAGIVSVAVQRDPARTSAMLVIAGLAFTAVVILVSELVNRRINATLRSWSAESIPAEYPSLRLKWERFHAVRTAAALLALCCYISAVLVP